VDATVEVDLAKRALALGIGIAVFINFLLQGIIQEIKSHFYVII